MRRRRSRVYSAACSAASPHNLLQVSASSLLSSVGRDILPNPPLSRLPFLSSTRSGAAPTAVRAMALNMGMLASNDQAKEILAAQGIVGVPNILGASAIAGFFASAFSLPFDYVKTQLQRMQKLPDGSVPYTGAIDCAVKTFKAGGPLKFYTGFPTFYVRIAPHAMITLMVQDTLQSTQKKMGY